MFLRQQQSQLDGYVAKALDMAVILDYWGREPGEMVTRVKGHKGEMMMMMLFNQCAFHASGSREILRAGVGGYRAAGQVWLF